MVSIILEHSKDFSLVLGVDWDQVRKGKRSDFYVKQARNGGSTHFALAGQSGGEVFGKISEPLDRDVKYYSGVMAVANSCDVNGTFIFAWKLDNNQYWIFAFKKRLPLPGTDRIVNGEEHAQKEFEGLCTYFSGAEVFCPSNWSMPSTIDFTFESVSPSKSARLHITDTKFEQIFKKIRNNKRLALFVAVCLAAGGLKVFFDHQEEVTREALIEAKRAEVRQRQEASTALSSDPSTQVKSEASLPYTNEPSVSKFIESCLQNGFALVKDVSGWISGDRYCNNSVFTAEFTGQGDFSAKGFVSEINKDVFAIEFNTAITQATLSRPISFSESVEPDIISDIRARILLADFFRSIGGVLTISKQSKSNSKISQNRTLVSYDFDVSLDFSPQYWTIQLAQIPGITLSELRHSNADKWILKGKIYAYT